MPAGTGHEPLQRAVAADRRRCRGRHFGALDRVQALTRSEGRCPGRRAAPGAAAGCPLPAGLAAIGADHFRAFLTARGSVLAPQAPAARCPDAAAARAYWRIALVL